MTKGIAPLLAAAAFTLAQDPAFVQPPQMTVLNDSAWRIEFTVSAPTDVEVSVVDPSSGRVVRHLAAGLLGTAAPAPLLRDSLHQIFLWNGRDDLKRPVALAAGCRVRVRAGMSVALDTILGESWYKFHRCIGGVATDAYGNLYAFGSYPRPMHHGTCMMTLRKYDRNGEYQKTLWPFPAGLNPATLTPFGLVTLPDNKYLPKSETVDVPQFGGTPMSYEDSYLLPNLVNGALLVYDRMELRYYLVRGDGAVQDTGRLVKSPALPKVSQYYGPWYGGPVYLSVSPDQRYFLLSGYYQINNPTFPAYAWSASDTGFWRDGQVFRVDAATGVAAPFISIPADSMPKGDSARKNLIGPLPSSLASFTYMAAFHGTAFDYSGHVFVCDRVRQEVGVYDTNGAKVGAIPVAEPDVVGWSYRNNAVYVVSRNFTGYGVGRATFRKFPDWQSGGGTPKILAKTIITTDRRGLGKAAAAQSERSGAPATMGRITLTVDESRTNTVIWVNGFPGANCLAESTLTNVRAVEDRGDTLVPVADLYPRARNINTGFDLVTVDRKTETVYFNDSWDVAYKVEDWSRPVFTRCSLSTGGTLSATQFAIGPDDMLWVGEFGYPTTSVKRYTQDHLHAPADFAGLGTNVAIPSGLISFGFGAGTKARGLTLLPDGRILIYNSSYILKVFDSTGALLRDSLIFPINQSGGLKNDPEGKIYTGILLRSPEHVIPAEYANYWPYTSATGAVVKFDPDSGGSINYSGISNPTLRTAAKALKVYPQPLSPFTGCQPLQVYSPSGSTCCLCRSPRFDVDPYGRLFMPHTVCASVSVADNEGNTLAEFGEYGNVDSRGPGSLVPGPVFPMAWPTAVAASEDYLYITDLVNARLMRVKMNYALDNIPGFTDRKKSVVKFAAVTPLMHAVPNPFNTGVTLRFTGGLPERDGRVIVYRLDGRAVRAIPAGAGRAVAWDGRDNRGSRVPGGVYVCRYEDGLRSLAVKVCHLR